MKQTTSAQPTAPGQTLNHDEADTLTSLFKALSDPSRLSLFSALADGEACVHELADRLGKEQSAVSHQLRILRNQNLVTTRRDGRHIHYCLTESHVRDVFTFALAHVRHATTGSDARETSTSATR